MTQIWGEMTGVSRKEPVLFEAFRTYHQHLMLPKVGTVLRFDEHTRRKGGRTRPRTWRTRF